MATQKFGDWVYSIKELPQIGTPCEYCQGGYWTKNDFPTQNPEFKGEMIQSRQCSNPLCFKKINLSLYPSRHPQKPLTSDKEAKEVKEMAEKRGVKFIDLKDIVLEWEKKKVELHDWCKEFDEYLKRNLG